MTHVKDRHRLLAACVAAACLAAILAGCGSAGERSSSQTVLHWYTGPDRADVSALAKKCTEQAGGRYSIQVESLPGEQTQRRSVLLKRLLAEDESMDLISMDDSFTAEFARAGVLTPIPDRLRDTFTDDVFDAAVESASYDGQLVAAPWWLDPMLLWYRPSAAERAGFSMDDRLGWDELMDGAERIDENIEIDDYRGQGISPLVHTLVAQAGGDLIAGHGRDAAVGLSGTAGKKAATILRDYRRSGLGKGPSSSAPDSFAGSTGAFMLAPSSVISDPALAANSTDLDWAPIPAVGDKGFESLSGYHLAVPQSAPHSTESFEAIECLTSAESMAEMMTSSGHSPASKAAYEAAGDNYPWADVTRKAVENSETIPSTAYWHSVHDGIEDTWMPLSDINASTPSASTKRIEQLMSGKKP